MSDAEPDFSEELAGDLLEELAENKALLDEAPDEGERAKAMLPVYLKEISRIPLLTPEEERSLALRVQAGDQEAERRLVEANLRLVVKVAKRYMHRGLPLLDLIEEGNLGLLHAARKFRPDKGARLSTYAAWWIRQSVVRALANQARLIRLPVHVELLLSRYRREKARLTQKLGRAPRLAEVAEAMEVPAEHLGEIEEMDRQPLSLEMPVGEERKGRLQDLLLDLSWPQERIGSLFGDPADLLRYLDDLSPNERTVLRLRFGLGGQEPLTLEAIGQRLGLTRERVRQIEAAGLQRLRKLLDTGGKDPAGPA